MINIRDQLGHFFESSFEITLNHFCTSNFPNLNFLSVIIKISKFFLFHITVQYCGTKVKQKDNQIKIVLYI